MRVIGVGALDSGELGLDFIDQTGTYSFPMYWDETGESWVALGVDRQPAAVLFSADGDELYLGSIALARIPLVGDTLVLGVYDCRSCAGPSRVCQRAAAC